MTKQPEALLNRFYEGEEAKTIITEATNELRRLHEVNQELLEAAQKVLSNKRGEGDWLILSTYCEDLEAAIAKAKEDEK